MSGHTSDYSLHGCIFETKPSPAPTLSAPKLNLPDRIDLRALCSPVENQQRTNSCVANAVVGALEFHQNKNKMPLTDLSRLFIYYNARSLSKSEQQDSGSYIHHGMAAVLAFGACEARMWPFQEAMVTTQPTEACYNNARNYDAVQYARTPRGVPALTALSQGLPVVFGMFAPGDYYKVASETGRMPRPDQIATNKPPSGHAMLIVGYDLTDRCYLVRNSWSASWAEGGYFWIPFETMDAWSQEEDFWTIGAIEQTSGFSLMGPSISESMTSVGVTEDLVQSTSQGVSALRMGLRQQLNEGLEAAKRDFRNRLRGK
ncbi:C1 family peptidase [Hyphomonas pacifica]|uniref:Peptidase C1A papain C-terminal domain-containing protein n=1 Tax=Hyphomonas pacifica TaxID=1280941 RepID=A0A062U5X1_9PROT|nr:C1 family peptidase [Hyphomonas pacifica]KCZ52039.1 hypothetical protein HY2_10060 [Hyphomonas pacifica]RAN34677.1 hypothetical protein HY3_10230 [Hyphomonas pacifica]RAN36230.1 hypothetical protein HY11_12455 [Hyphomonas pacifica]